MKYYIKYHHLSIFIHSNYGKKLVLGLCMIFAGSNALAQEDSKRLPVYSIPYMMPSVNGIKGTLTKVKDFYLNTGKLAIVDSKTGKNIDDFKTFNPDAEISKGFASEWSYTNGVVFSAFEYLDNIIDDKSFFEVNIKFFNFVADHLQYFNDNGKIINGSWGNIQKFHALDDCGSIGAAMIKTYLKDKTLSKERKIEYLKLINRTAEFVSNEQFRLKDGTLARNRPQYQSVWADDMYMGIPFLVNMGKLTGNTKYYDDAVKQVLQISDRLFIPEKGLFDHGWNLTSDKYDPRFYWGRANGWALMTMAEVLSILPENYKGRDKILNIYRTEIQTLANLQDGSGFWHNLLDKETAYQETSATAMITFAIAKGINEGWISHVYGPVAITGWNAVESRVLENGAVEGTCEATTFAHDNVYYYNRGKSIYATHGYGPVIYAGAEMIRLLQNDKITIVKAKDDSLNSTFHFTLKSEWPKK